MKPVAWRVLVKKLRRLGFEGPLPGGRHPFMSREHLRLHKLIEDDGWRLVTTRGSHRQYKHPIKQGRVTIAGHPGDDLAAGTLNSVLKQAGLKEVK